MDPQHPPDHPAPSAPPSAKPSALEGKLYVVAARDNAALKDGYMKGCLFDGLHVFCFGPKTARGYRYAPVFQHPGYVQVYPRAFWFFSARPIGVLSRGWQPSADEAFLVPAGHVFKGVRLTQTALD